MQPQQNIWSKRALLPFWLVQLICFAIIFIVGCIAFGLINNTEFSESSDQTVDEWQHLLRIGAGLNVGLSGVCIILNFTEIVLYVRKRLSPAVHLSSACVKTAIWLFFFVTAIVGAVQGAGSGSFIAIAAFISCLGQLIYGSVIMHRKRTGKLNVVTEEYGMAASNGGAQKWASAPEASYPAAPPYAQQQRPAFGRA